MSPKCRAGVLAPLLVLTPVAASADETASIKLDAVVRSSVIPWRAGPDAQTRWFVQTPQAKLFNARGELEAWGLPPDFLKRLAGEALAKRDPSERPVTVVRLDDERRVLSLKAPLGQGKPCLVLYESTPCPPCERLLEPVLAKSRAKYGKDLQLVRVKLT